MNAKSKIDRRAFLQTAAASAALAAFPAARAAHAQSPAPSIKVAVIGCGSVSTKYLPHLARSPHVQLVSACDIRPERARRAADTHKIPNAFPHVDQLLAGPPFDLLVNLTDMQEHERLNRLALHASRHVFSEKPMANSPAAAQALLDLARQKSLRLWGAPTAVASPQFAFMARTIAAGALGRIAAAHASYGHLGPDWASFFYDEGGGSLPDLGVYNITTLTGLLGPARSVTAMTSVVTPTRNIRDKGPVPVVAEDNTMLIIDHGRGALSHIQCGFNYFTAREHDYTRHDHHTITITGTQGAMSLAGYDWAPHAVDLATRAERAFKRHAAEPHDYQWENGASLAAKCLATGTETLFTPEHAIHVLEIIAAANQSQETKQHIPINSTFPHPIL